MGEAVLLSTNATADERKVYETIIHGFSRLVIYERATFNCRSQKDGESAEQYIMELYNVAETCDYGEITDQMIRGRKN